MVQKPLNSPRGWRAIWPSIKGALVSIFLFSSLIAVNIVQTLSLVVLPFSRRAFRAINRACANTWWGTVVVGSQVVYGVKAVITGDALPEKENVIVVANHQQMPDIVALFFLAWRQKRLGDMKWFVKDILKYVPGIGWGMLYLDCLFVKRNWDADAGRIHDTFSKFLRDRIPIWLMQFSEGTRITAAKLARSREYAQKAGQPLPENVLIPRTKGFVASMQGLGTHLQAVYDVTIAYPQGIPTLWQYAMDLVPEIHMHVRRFTTPELPTDPKGLSEWLLDRFRRKDRLLTAFAATGRFPSAE